MRRAVLVTTICSFVLFAYWGLFTWTPAYLASPVERGGAGLGIVKSLRWIIAVQAGAFLGYMTCGYIADVLGRRPAFLLFTLSAAVLVPFYAAAADHEPFSSESAYRPEWTDPLTGRTEGTDVLMDFSFEHLSQANGILKLAATKL